MNDAVLWMCAFVIVAGLLLVAFTTGHRIGDCHGRCYPLASSLHGDTCGCADGTVRE